MKIATATTLLLAAAVLAPALSASAEDPEIADVHLVVETHAAVRAGLTPSDVPQETPGTGECDVQVPVEADGAAVLDAAVEKDCIVEWDHEEFDGARFVTSIDRLRAPGLTCLAFAVGICDWWEFSVNGQTAGYGIDGYTAEDGDQIDWLYRNTMGYDTRP